ncbi:radical SAM/CxCxxxxC motif protein YfkAB [Halalkalibacterium halodurans]|uniref:Radical SAM protein n=1 Tax=Halalkalibacterium halodurans TaxID=86665 RepID=A0A0M0KD82_ALKHA|nr:radical SAM/CxCxxxxC motif protein YfkAB [Halalkalibacterium halodurans]MED3646390.1 radical SAM/CxCxxxxC motif protein YfkAB [Halalkalibacterium halodurans]TPE70339.1 radical SAM/CxCxxxxC motif protein YfkAB [Halalkalibacterium halodurans]
MNTTHAVPSITPNNDPWEAYDDIKMFGKPTLTNIEVTTTTLCNMRCEHCAVGYTLQTKDPDALPLDLLLRRLDEIPHLRAFSITGGEPMLSKKSVESYVVPLLRYAHERGARTQINSNLTLNIERYEKILPYLDVLHISHNYGSINDFTDIGFAVMERKPSIEQREALFHRMVENAKMLTQEGVFVSAETMINKRTLPHLEKIHEQIVSMGCQRHEVHPMYPSDFASALDVASLDEIRKGIHRLLDARDKKTWMLFGTLPFYPCSDQEEDLMLLKRLYGEPNVTVRNDPDGRSRLNVNLFDGNIIVTDFGDTPPLGNIMTTSFIEAYEKWQQSEISKKLSCHCPMAECLGPNILVKNTYYREVDFHKRKAVLHK